MIWAVFVSRAGEGQKVAVRVLGQIDSPGSSRALALLALTSPDAEVRRNAIQILRHRDPRDFAPDADRADPGPDPVRGPSR